MAKDDIDFTLNANKTEAPPEPKKKASNFSFELIDLDKSENKNQDNSLSKSLLRLLDGPHSQSIERLAFTSDPSISNTYQSVYHAKLRLIPDTVLKRIGIQDDLVAAIVNTRSGHISHFGRRRKNRFEMGFDFEINKGVEEKLDDKQKQELTKKIDQASKLLSSCGNSNGYNKNEQLTFSSYLSQTVRNAILVGRIATEIIPDKNGDFHSFRPLDAGTIYRATGQKDALENVRKQALRTLKLLNKDRIERDRIDITKFQEDEYSWVQVIDNTPKQVFTDDECLVYNFYPVPDVELDGYPVTPLDTVIGAVTTHINIGTHNKLYFQHGRAAKGMIIVQSEDANPKIAKNIKQQFEACLAPDVPIITKEYGQILIGGVIPEGSTQKEVTIWTGRDWQKSLVYRTKEKKQLVYTYFNNATKISTSPEHKFWVITKDGLIWKEQKDLQIGDYVALNNKEIVDESNVPEYNGKKITPEIMEVLGWMTGDGTLAYDGDYARNMDSFRLYYHHEKEPEILKRHLGFLEGFGVKAQEYRYETSDENIEALKEKYGFKDVSSYRIGINCYDVVFIRWLASIGFTSSKQGKCIPSFIYTLSTELKVAFLKGYFSADGCNAQKKDPAIYIIKDDLRAQTKQLLLTLGIRTSATEGMSTPYFKGSKKKHNSLRVKDRRKFFALIGFLQPHKQPIIDFEKSTNNKKDRVPTEVIVRFARELRCWDDIHKKLPKSLRSFINDVSTENKPCSRTNLLKLMNLAGFSPPDWLVDYNFEPVVEIEKTNESIDMFDVEVYDEKHTFCANGIITHNSVNSVANAFRLPVFSIGQEDKVLWQQIDNPGRDAEFQYLFDMNCRAILAAFQMAPEELTGYSYLSRGSNQKSLSESSNEFSLEQQKDSGVRPLIRKFEDFINASIIPLIDKDVARLCTFKFVGLNAQDPDQEIQRLSTEAQLHGTLDEILQKVEKKPIGKEFGGTFPFNPLWQAVADKYLTVGVILEKFFGKDGAAKDESLQYVRDPFWFQYQQFKMQMQQIQAQQQMAERQQQMEEKQSQAQNAPQNAPGQPQAQPGQQSTPQQQNPGIKNPEAAQGAVNNPQGQQGQIGGALDQVLGHLNKSEPLATKQKLLDDQYKETIERFREGWRKDIDDTVSEVLFTIAKKRNIKK